MASSWLAAVGTVDKTKPQATRHFGSNCLVWDVTMGLTVEIIALNDGPVKRLLIQPSAPLFDLSSRLKI